MKKVLVIVLVLACCSADALAQNIKAYLAYSRFYSEQTGPYIETYLTVIGNTLKYTTLENNKSLAEVNITLAFKQGEEIKYADKYTLQSPEFDANVGGVSNLIDQQRIPLKNGDYEFEITISDKNNPEREFKHSEPVSISFTTEAITISDIQLIENYQPTTTPNVLTKSGYDLVPYSNNYYPEYSNSIKFYTEIYNTDKVFSQGSTYVVNMFVENADNGMLAAGLNRFSKQKADKVNVLLSEFNIEKLSSGNYNLVIEVHDKDNKLVQTQKAFFQRSAPQVQITLDDLQNVNVTGTFVDAFNQEQLEDYIKSLWPISSPLERVFSGNQLNYSDHEAMKKYFYSFWQKRSPSSPEAEWKKYAKEVEKVNQNYGTSISKGYETDRGRVYLQYGPPNTIAPSTYEPNTFPYEIWHYYRIENSEATSAQGDRRFVFYTRELSSNNYELLHSDAIGEIRNVRWHLDLQGRTDQFFDLDTEQGEDHYGGRSQDFFNDPR